MEAQVAIMSALACTAAVVATWQLLKPPCPRCGGRKWERYWEVDWWRCASCGDWVDWR